MNNNICRNCGQTNSPKAEMCIKCGFQLFQPGNDPFNHPPKTIKSASEMPMFAPSSAKPDALNKSRSKLYWVLGGIGALILFGGFFIVALAAGIYFYTSSNDAVEYANINKNQDSQQENLKSSSETERTDTSKQVFDDEKLAAVFGIKKQVGKFKHLSTLPAPKSPSKKIFQNSDGEATAMYIGKGKKENIMYVLASYSSTEKAKEEFRNFIAREKRNGAKMLLDVTIDNENKSINANYKKGTLTKVSFCSWKSELSTMCHSMMSPDGASVLNFHNSWFGIKQNLRK